MKKLLLITLSISLLLSITLWAEIPVKQPKYKVEIVQSNKKGFKKVVFIKIKDFFFAVVEKVSVDNIASEIQEYVNLHGLNPLKINKRFNKRIKIALLSEFNASNWRYNSNQSVSINYSLRQNAYTYLLSKEKNDVCLIYPSNRQNNLQSQSDYTLDGFGFNQRGTVELYMIASLLPIDFSSFRANGIYRCTSRYRGENKINLVKKDNNNHVRRFDIVIE